ncbi:hypothetical protein G5714_022671 [Onychostoma macrolepis]|uniref:PGC-1 and ERR-induced regulator in muscle protein 1 n=1 Tax=Onychostoma macrolepis TaxID=369639 RepID=A0A7J6BSR7_9TELE|nr:hypothetical protein G5714_022671 [Onychostoma macrolepis]
MSSELRAPARQIPSLSAVSKCFLVPPAHRACGVPLLLGRTHFKGHLLCLRLLKWCDRLTALGLLHFAPLNRFRTICECEDCDLLSPVLASREDSGMSDIDEMGCLLLSKTPAMGIASTDPDPDLQIDGPPDFEGSPVCNYLSKYGIRSPEQVLSGSEEDLDLQTVNLFFEQLKSVTENPQPLEQSHVIIRGSEKTGHLEGLIDKQDILSADTGPSGRNEANLRGEITKQGVAHTWGDMVSKKSLEITPANAQEGASKTDTELVIGRKLLTTPLITVRMKQEQQGRCSGLSKDLELTPETKPPDKEKMVVVNRKDVIDPYPARQNIAQLDAISSSDLKDSPIGQIPVSPSRRKRRKKKRMSVEPVEQGHEAQIHYQQIESEEERFIQREEISNLPANPRNSDESDDKRDISVNEVAVSARNNSEQLFCGKSIRSSGPTEGMLSEDPTQDVSELPQNTVAEIKDTSSSELKSGTKDLESVSLDASNQLPCPVFAISSFWNEMEKLTINDILRLRLISNAQHSSILTQPEDGSIADTTDAADSGYFTQPDDSKPDHLSGDMSYISDLDEDLAQLQTPFPSKQEDELSEFPSSCGVMWENDPDPVIVGDEMVHISSETALPEHLYTANAQQCFRRMCKNMSVQNLQALDTQPIRQILRNASMHSIHSEVEDDFMDPFYHVNTSGSKIFSDDEEEIESSGITFSEIVQYFFGEDEPERCASRADNIAASYLDGTSTSLPETYDHFFSEFDSGSFVCPIVEESGGDKMVPIFSCSRLANRNLQFPEAYDYFFPDSPGSSDEDDENDNAAIKVVTQYDYKSPNHDPVDMYEHFLSEDESDFLWTNPLSLRKVRRTGFTVPKGNTCSGELVPVKTFPKGIIQPINAMSPDGSPFPDSLLLNLENRIFQQLAEQQKKCMEMQPIVADPRLDVPFLPLKQADMCLVCIAFASWVLKSTGSGADTWKAALLANVSALSAIRYLRRHKREEVSGKTPLRQIEPA